MAYLYFELDGKVYTVRRENLLDLPREDEPIPFSYEAVYRLPWGEEGVILGRPILSHYPVAWLSKDDVPLRDDVSPILREAVHSSFPRAVAEGIIRRKSEVLLVRAARGLTTGRWSLPGGFLSFGETPEEAAKREIEEEVGAPCRIKEFLGVRAKVGRESGLHWLMFFFAAELLGVPNPNPDEIIEVCFFPIKEAADRLADETMAAFLRELASQDVQ